MATASRPEFNDNFVDLLQALADCNVDFLVVGAHALAAHGVVRATGDLDVFVRATHNNALLVTKALRAFGAPLALHGPRTTLRAPGPCISSGCRRGTLTR